MEGLHAVPLGLGERGLGVQHVERRGGTQLVVGVGHLRGPARLRDAQLGRAEDARGDAQPVDGLLRLEVDPRLERGPVLLDLGAVGARLRDLAGGAPAVEDGHLQRDPNDQRW
jgi:hypothetical protein